MTYSFGIFYKRFLNYFDEGNSYTAWIASILVGMTLCSGTVPSLLQIVYVKRNVILKVAISISGPISSSFVNRYGCRTVTIAGSILAAACLVLSVLAKNVLTLIITIGFGVGTGLGLIYLPAIVSVTMYFEKYRSLATGNVQIKLLYNNKITPVHHFYLL